MKRLPWRKDRALSEGEQEFHLSRAYEAWGAGVDIFDPRLSGELGESPARESRRPR